MSGQDLASKVRGVCGPRRTVSDPDLLSQARIRVFDSEDLLRSSTRGDQQPYGGVPLGGAGRVEVECASSCAFRAVFSLIF